LVSTDHASPTPSTSSALKTPENEKTQKRTCDDPELEDEGDIQMEYSCD
jgi:hypothetical protein